MLLSCADPRCHGQPNQPAGRSCRAIALAAGFFSKGALRARLVFLRISEAGANIDWPSFLGYKRSFLQVGSLGDKLGGAQEESHATRGRLDYLLGGVGAPAEGRGVHGLPTPPFGGGWCSPLDMHILKGCRF